MNHQFSNDLYTMLGWLEQGRPFALSRFGDGELAVLEEREHRPYGSMFGTETWLASRAVLREDLLSSAAYSGEGYFVGVPPICCQFGVRERVLSYIKTPPQRQTYNTIFCNGNYDRLHGWLSGSDVEFFLVAGEGTMADVEVPLDAICQSAWLEDAVQAMMGATAPILVAAGPAACILVHRYWTSGRASVPVVDVGSALDEILWGKPTRWHTVGGGASASRWHDCTLHGREPCAAGCSPHRFAYVP